MLFNLTAFAQNDYHWKLGAGKYWNVSPYASDIDDARWDWLYVQYINEESIEALNRYLKINPDQKYLMRLTVNYGVQGTPSNQVNMLDFYFSEDVQEEILTRIDERVQLALQMIDIPENIVGFMFNEELPGNYGLGKEICQQDDPWVVPPFIADNYQDQIEAALGIIPPDSLDNHWDDTTRLWLGERYVETLDMIHSRIKQNAPDKMVLYHHHQGYRTLAELDDGASISESKHYPFDYAQLMETGNCDGLMTYPRRSDPETDLFYDSYLRFIEAIDENGEPNWWAYFNQLSHPTGMRLGDWQYTLDVVNSEHPSNMGYFFYGSGDCITYPNPTSGWQRNDQSIPPEDDIYIVSYNNHIRRFCSEQNVGMDIINEYLRPTVEIDFPLDTMIPSQPSLVTAVVRNPKTEEYFFNNSTYDATARDVHVSISLPVEWYSVPDQQEVFNLGDLGPEEFTTFVWEVTPPSNFTGEAAISITAVDLFWQQPRTVTVDTDTRVTGFLTHKITRSDSYATPKWSEPGYRFGSGHAPILYFDGILPVSNPTLTDGIHTITYEDILRPGVRLVITPDAKAELRSINLVTPNSSLRDEADPDNHDGFKPWRPEEGYSVSSTIVNRRVDPNAEYTLKIAGKSDNSENSQVVISYDTIAGGSAFIPDVFLLNRFTEQWGEYEQNVVFPGDAFSVKRIYLYNRGHDEGGTIWYGYPELRRAIQRNNLIPIIPDLVDGNDPDHHNGYKPWHPADGYHVPGTNINKSIENGAIYTLKISGKSDNSQNSQVIISYNKFDGGWDNVPGAFLVNRFTEQWGEYEQEIVFPEDAESVKRIYLYNRGYDSDGTIWYGQPALYRNPNMVPYIPELVDESDPDHDNGYRPWRPADGYHVPGTYVNKSVENNLIYTLKISGKSDNTQNSQVVISYNKIGGGWDFVPGIFLCNRFNGQWGEYEQEIVFPEDAESVKRIYLYNRGYNSGGTIWYGQPVLYRNSNIVPYIPELVDESDPDHHNGYKPWRPSDGYHVPGVYVSAYLVDDVYTLRISGKSDNVQNSQVIISYNKIGGGWDFVPGVFLVNRFTEQWGEYEQEVVFPEDALSIRRIYLYNRGYDEGGTIWYGQPEIERSNFYDVSERIFGDPIQIAPGTMTDLTYSDIYHDPITSWSQQHYLEVRVK